MEIFSCIFLFCYLSNYKNGCSKNVSCPESKLLSKMEQSMLLLLAFTYFWYKPYTKDARGSSLVSKQAFSLYISSHMISSLLSITNKDYALSACICFEPKIFMWFWVTSAFLAAFLKVQYFDSICKNRNYIKWMF